MRELGEALDDGVEDLVRVEAGGVLEARLDHETQVAVPALQPGDDVAGTEGDGQQVRRHVGDVCRRGQTRRGGGAELENTDEAVPEHDGCKDDAMETASREESSDHLVFGWLGLVDGEDHGRAAGYGAGRQGVFADVPPAALVDGVSAAVAGRKRRGDIAVDPVDRTSVEAGPGAQSAEGGQNE